MSGFAKYGDAFCPALEGLDSGLGTIPGCDFSDPRHQERDAEWRLRFFEWQHRLEPIRLQVHRAAATDARVRAGQIAICDTDWVYFLCMFGWTYDPRIREKEDPDKPMALFAFQANKVSEVQRVGADPAKIDVFDTKARGIGLTDTYAGAALAGWR